MNESKNKNSENHEPEKSFNKGNINFDVLEPEHPHGYILDSKKNPVLIRRSTKRGIFDAKGQKNSISRFQVYFWFINGLSSLAFFIYIIFFASSIFWILAVPLVTIGLLWSIIMMVLFKARPR